MARTITVLLLLVAACVVLYAPTVNYDFIDLDDRFNINENPRLKDGLTPGNVVWAMTTNFGDYWHPMMWITLMGDVEIWGGLDPRGFHLTNVILHTLASVLAFAALRCITGAFWPSAMVAAMFALHPTRVESIAWITERKDVLSAVLWWGTIWAYGALCSHDGHVRVRIDVQTNARDIAMRIAAAGCLAVAADFVRARA
jgi:protein O-mannosyl-transferase